MNKRITLIEHIKGLIYDDESHLNGPLRGYKCRRLKQLSDAYLLIVDDKIADFGHMQHCRQHVHERLCKEEEDIMGIIDAKGGYVLPGFCDSHTHLLYPCSREQELFDRARGLSYTQITQRGGGIHHSASCMAQLSDEELLLPALARLDTILSTGTTTVEIKSGYGLTVAQEIRMLRLIKQLKAQREITIKSTFLGAHAYPSAFAHNHSIYMGQLLDEMIPQIAQELLADYVDVFCEQGFFSVSETARILERAAEYGLKGRLHTNQFHHIGGIACGLAHQVRTLDHLEVLTDEEIDAIAQSDVIATLLPGCSFFMDEPYAPAARLIKAGAALALATDYNPGTNPSGSMPFVLSLACMRMHMKVEEAIHAATINGAYALDCADSQGSITVGKRADLILTKPIPSLQHLPYAYTDNQIESVFCGGKWI